MAARSVAATAGAVLQGFGLDAVTDDRNVRMVNHSGVLVVDSCNGLAALGLFAGFILAYPGTWRRRSWFIPLGLLAVFVANVIRVSLLVYFQQAWPKAFDLIHNVGVSTFFYLVVFGLWVAWANFGGSDERLVLAKEHVPASCTMRSFMIRLGAVALFCVLLFGVWQPTRTVLVTKVVHPLARIATDDPTEAIASPPSVMVALVDREVTYSIPGGIHLLIPGLLLVALAPRKPYWLVLWVVLLVMGLILLLLFLLGLSGFGTSFAVGDFIPGYAVPPFSLGLAFLLLSQNRRQRTCEQRLAS